MLEPTGPLPPEIYWRRRVFAIAALVLALALVIWVALMVARRGSSEPAAAAASSTPAASHRSAEPSKSGDPANKSAEAAAAGKPSAGAEASPVKPSGPPVTSAAVLAAPPPGQCPDQSLAVKVTVEQPTYKSGEQPVFWIVITNISQVACSRDLGSGLQQVSVQTLDGQRRMWSSTDCYPDGQPDIRALNRGEQAGFTVTWSGSTSQQTCAGERVQVPAGAYAVVAQLGSIRSAAEPFNIA
ncbi:hypothetical protein D5S18_25290 [Nocardia panacis]|uniref:DUF4232 domain-containing protein n=1 Tax=Nocardia panacis TaxID=2340916 RepID=A0A3A4JPZ6_9NOCA|nr:hypothetical protein [Nocardia panacis]RJO71227.1 hypothetical protein D5S18_25290 [Nocardia panacis]